MTAYLTCPECRTKIKKYRNPLPTVDIIIKVENRIVLIERKNEPKGWALPGGFVDHGESLEQAAVREAKEETGLSLNNLRQFHAYSDPTRDPRHHTITQVFIADGTGSINAGDDAKRAQCFPLNALPDEICFDHARIIEDYRQKKF